VAALRFVFLCENRTGLN